MDGRRYAYEGERLYVEDVELDLDRILTDSQYLDQVMPGLSSVSIYTLKCLPFMDPGVYFIRSDDIRTTNLLSGISTETDEFDILFSFRGLLRQILLF